MTAQAQNIAIHQACGWTRTQAGGIRQWFRGNDWCQSTPNYQSDLNAMHAAENTEVTYHGLQIALADHVDYYENLANVVDIVWDINMDWIDISKIVSASASQRAEAFLRALGLWEE